MRAPPCCVGGALLMVGCVVAADAWLAVAAAQELSDGCSRCVHKHCLLFMFVCVCLWLFTLLPR